MNCVYCSIATACNSTSAMSGIECCAALSGLGLGLARNPGRRCAALRLRLPWAGLLRHLRCEMQESIASPRVQTDDSRFLAVVEVALDGVADVAAQFVERVGLGEDRFAQSSRGVAA